MDESVERELVERSRDGDSEAFGRLMDEHQERIYSLAYRISGGAEAADAVTQDTFVQAHRSLAQFKGRSRFMTWLYSIAVRKAIDWSRRQKAGRKTLCATGLQLSADARRAGQPGPDEILHAKELAGLMQEAIMQLPDEQREALILIAQEEVTYREAAKILNRPEGTVAWQVWSARKALRDMLGDYLAPG